MDFQDAWDDKIELQVPGPDREMRLLMIGFGDLVRNKRVAARPKDLDDLRALGETDRH